MKKKIFVVEDHPFMRRSIIEALEREPDLAVCGQAEDAQTAFTAIAALQPDVVVTDLELKSSSGLELIKSLRARAQMVPVIAMTMFDVNEYSFRAGRAGATAFVSKQGGPDKLVAAIHALLKAGNASGPDDEPPELSDR